MPAVVLASDPKPTALREFVGFWPHVTKASRAHNKPLQALRPFMPKQKNTAKHKQAVNNIEQHATEHVPVVLASRSTIILTNVPTTVAVPFYAKVTQPRSLPAHSMLLAMLLPAGLAELPVGKPNLVTPPQVPTVPASRSTLTLIDGSVVLFDVSSHATNLLPGSTTAQLISAAATAGLVIGASFWSRWARKDEFSSQMRGISRRSVWGLFPVLGLALRLPGQRIL